MADDPLTATFAALADPTRRRIVSGLARGETSVMELAKPFKITLPTISKHPKVLEPTDLIQHSRDAQWRPCQLQAQLLRNVADWGEQYRRFWGKRLDRLADYLQDLQSRQAATM